ncbi:hypothetical protein GCM10007173_18960 [Glutamicibacter ardleyensis]|uniref:Secreted protein n=1 Tax=Glutamicibacter ardleyensis TaxID=225894 RepID=A0ABQ2DKJ0_9MICC|nr:hypothetical protein GCM10007173_18960 [Glutamicibacter ardleyensis]
MLREIFWVLQNSLIVRASGCVGSKLMIIAHRRVESALGMEMSVPESHVANVHEVVRHRVHDVMRSCVHKVLRQDILTTEYR